MWQSKEYQIGEPGHDVRVVLRKIKTNGGEARIVAIRFYEFDPPVEVQTSLEQLRASMTQLTNRLTQPEKISAEELLEMWQKEGGQK